MISAPWKRLLRADFAEALTYSKSLGRYSETDLAGTQLAKLRLIWEDCTRDVPYYIKLVETRKAPRRIESWSDFDQIPILDRRILKENAADFLRNSEPADEVRL